MSVVNGLQYRREMAVVRLARQTKEPVDDVARLYADELAKLEVGAHITAFLPVFAIRKVREILRLRSKGKTRVVQPRVRALRSRAVEAKLAAPAPGRG